MLLFSDIQNFPFTNMNIHSTYKIIYNSSTEYLRAAMRHTEILASLNLICSLDIIWQASDLKANTWEN